MRSLPLSQRDLASEPVVVGPTQVTPVMREHALRWPGGGLLWRRPVALRVHTEGHAYQVPILNVTRRAICAAIATGALFALLIAGLTHLKMKRSN